MIPLVGDIVIYKLTSVDVDQINRRRTTGVSIAERIKVLMWPVGAQAHIGNSVEEGMEFPMLIVRVWGYTQGSAVQGQVFLDGNDVYWATSKLEGNNPGEWRVK